MRAHCTCGHPIGRPDAWCAYCQTGACTAPAEPDAGDVEALHGHSYEHFDEDDAYYGRCYLEADVLRLLDAVRRKAGDERAERIAQAIEALPFGDYFRERAARIARGES